MADTNSNGTRAPDDSDTNTARQGKVKRGKTRDAFAFRDFDEDRILQRVIPILCEANKRLKATSDDFKSDDLPLDDEFLKTILVDINELPLMTKREAENLGLLLVYIGKSYIAYSDKISRHIKRLTRFITALADKIEKNNSQSESLNLQRQRANKLILKYCKCLHSVSFFAQKFLRNRKNIKTKFSIFYRKQFAEKLRQVRQEKRKTQAQVAAELGLTVGAYQFYETARREPNIATLIQLSVLFDVTPNWLLGFE